MAIIHRSPEHAEIVLPGIHARNDGVHGLGRLDISPYLFAVEALQEHRVGGIKPVVTQIQAVEEKLVGHDLGQRPVDAAGQAVAAQIERTEIVQHAQLGRQGSLQHIVL